MDYSIAAIETMYEGTLFRSRLEAQWAAFFDLAGWKWKYEPFDRDGWIPDFGLEAAGAPNGILLVEVKPIMALDMNVAAKIDRADCAHEAMIVGAGPFVPYGGWISAIGWMREDSRVAEDDPVKWSWGVAFCGRWNERVGVRAEYGSWHDRISNSYNGNAGAEAVCGEVGAWWREAGNKVRWEKK